MVSVCLPSGALSQHLPSYLGFSYLGREVSLHGCSSKAQLLLLTLDEGYLPTATPPDLERGVAPLGPPVPMQPPLLGVIVYLVLSSFLTSMFLSELRWILEGSFLQISKVLSLLASANSEVSFLILSFMTLLWVASSRWWWRTGKPGVLQSMGLQTVGQDWVSEQRNAYGGEGGVDFIPQWQCVITHFKKNMWDSI